MTEILVAEDVAEMREAIEIVLEAEGYNVTLAEDGEVASRLLEEGAFALVILDIWMPKKGGLELMKEVAENYPETTIIAISGGGPDATLENVTSLADLYGAIRVLYKPFEDEELLGAVREALGA